VSAGPSVTLFAHRGASKDYPEQTRAAYLEAIAQGADGLETDVRLTADGHLVCWHDVSTDRTTGVAGFVHELTLAQLRKLDLLRGADLPVDRGGSDQLMTLPDLLELMVSAGRPLRLALEIKQPSPFGAALDEAVLEALDAAGWNRASGRLGAVEIDIMCFWPQTVATLCDELGDGRVMLLLEDASRDELAYCGDRSRGVARESDRRHVRGHRPRQTPSSGASRADTRVGAGTRGARLDSR
jgi:glycerophosphoryl diester phosphodiesterase